MRPKLVMTSRNLPNRAGDARLWATDLVRSFRCGWTPRLSRHWRLALRLKESLHAQKQSAPQCVNGRTLPELHQSARKHYERDRLDDVAVLYAAAHVLNSRPALSTSTRSDGTEGSR